MEANTLPRNIVADVTKLTKKPWTTMSEADAAADFIRQLRLDAHALGALTDEEIQQKKTIDAKLAAEANALKDAAAVEAELKPVFIAFTQDETERINSTLPVSKQSKNIVGKGWKVQLKDKPGMVTVTNTDNAVAWLEKTEPAAVKVVKTVNMSEVGKQAVIDKLKKLAGAQLAKIGMFFTPTIADGNSNLKVDDLDIQ